MNGEWVNCPICGEFGMHQTVNKDGDKLIECNNHACKSNGGNYMKTEEVTCPNCGSDTHKHQINQQPNFRFELERIINCYSKENGSNTPDFMLTDYLINCLTNFDNIVKRREEWYGRKNYSIGCGVLTVSETPPETK